MDFDPESVAIQKPWERLRRCSIWSPPSGFETGLIAEIGMQLWIRRHTLRFRSRLVDQIEHYFLVQLTNLRPVVANYTSEAIAEHRWWSRQELLQSRAVFFPQGFVKLVGAVIEGIRPRSPISI
jgi:hypothetical protein